MSILFKLSLQVRPFVAIKIFSRFKFYNSADLLTQGNNKNGSLRDLIKRFNSSTSENPIKLLNDRLADNKSKNILIYSLNKSGSTAVNTFGVVGCVLLLFASYNSFLLFSSVRFKNRKIEDDGGFSSRVFRAIGSERFKYSLCGVVAFIGIYL